jgi:hypothetical protein
LLTLTTKLARYALPVLVFLTWAPAASAWSWPVQGPVLQPFSYDEAHPYAAGQHRGVDIGADATGATVVAPAAGTVSFAGTVPTNGETVTIETQDGYSVTLTHLGSIVVARGAAVDEQQKIGTVGPSGTPEAAVPYVHLGIRVTNDQYGYVDPLGLLPPAAEGSPDSTTTTSQPASSGGSTTVPASTPADPPRARPRPVTKRGSRGESGASDASVHRHQRAKDSHEENAQRTRSPHSSAQQPAGEQANLRTQHPEVATQHRAIRPATSSNRLVVEPVASSEPTGLDAGHEARPSVSGARPGREPFSPPYALLCNLAAALFALGAVLLANRRRRGPNASPAAGAEVVRLPPPAVGHADASRAA